MFRCLLLSIISLILFSCNGNDIVDRMNNIKVIGDKDPELAASMLDSVYTDMVNAAEYDRMKYELLRVRLNDKNNVIPNSNKMVEILANYFNSNGTIQEKQEAYYYAGSVYRDLDDTPRALENFYKSIEVIKENAECDTILLRNTYSNLYCLFTNVQDDSTALEMAQKEYSLSCKIGNKSVNTIMHLAESLIDMKMTKKAQTYLNEAFDSIRLERNASEDNYIYIILYDLSKVGMRGKASECYNLIKRRKLKRNDTFVTYIYGNYYELINQLDSAIVCYERIFSEGNDEYAMYDVSKDLFRLYSHKGNLSEANRYGAEFIKYSKILDLSKNQKLAATVNNKYKYHLDQKLVQKVKHERTLYMRAVVGLAVFILLLVLVMTIFYTRKKNAMLRKQLAAVNELSSVRMRYNEMQEDLDAKIRQLNSVKAELDANDLRLKQANADIDRYTAELNAARKSLEEKQRQSQSLMQMLHRTELSSEAEDVIVIVKEAACGKRKLYAKEWQQIYSAVDSLWHDFRKTLVARLGTFTEQQMQVCYLMRIGLNNPQICSVTDISRTTIWRWTKAYAWIYKLPKVCDLM